MPFLFHKITGNTVILNIINFFLLFLHKCYLVIFTYPKFKLSILIQVFIKYPLSHTITSASLSRNEAVQPDLLTVDRLGLKSGRKQMVAGP